MSTGSTFKHAMIGLVGGLAGALTMDLYARAVNRATGGREAVDAAPGAERSGRGMQPPQAEGVADDDAAVRAASAVFRTVTGAQPGRRARLRLGTVTHYAFGGAAGVCYALVVARAPQLRAGHGAVYGSLVWAIADEGMMPALGLSRGPRQMSAGLHAYSLAGHWVYGTTLELVRSSLADARR